MKKNIEQEAELRMDAREFDDLMRKALGATPAPAPPKTPKPATKTKKDR